MCTTAETDAIEKTVQDKVSKGEMFTAFDITKEARTTSGLKMRHSDVKFDVHNAVSRIADSYLRTPISIPGVPDRPFLYYPQGSDPNSYGIAGQSQVAVTSSTPTPAPALPAITNAVPTYPANPDPDVVTPDNRGRIWIPNRFISGLGVKHQTPVYVTQSTMGGLTNSVNILKITTAVPAGATNAVEYLVDKSANIAISRGVLLDAGIDGSNKYKVEGTATEVIVKIA